MIDIESGETVGETIPVGVGPSGVAITPDGERVYVANHGSDSVSVIDTESGATVGAPIPVGDGPRGVAIAPDGKRVYVANYLSHSVSVIDTGSGATVGLPIPVGDNPLGIAIARDGKRVYVANWLSDRVSVIDAESGATAGLPIPVGDNPLGIQISPDGDHAYVANELSNTVSIIDTTTGGAIGAVPVGSGPTGIAVAPDGRRPYVGSWGTDAVSVIDTDSGDVVGAPIGVGSSPLGIAIVPNQSPAASLLASATGTAGQQIRFDASASHDPDGQIARYDWDFGDGQLVLDAGPTATHAYSAPGTYRVTVTLTDSEGCSTNLVFTGLTASCNGSSAASATTMLQLGPPPDQPGPPGTPEGTPPPGKPPAKNRSNAFRIGKLRRDMRLGIAKLKVRVPGRGTLLLRGTGIRTVRRRFGRAGTVTLAVRPKRTQAKALRRRGRLDVRTRITFRPHGGVARTVARTLTLVYAPAR